MFRIRNGSRYGSSNRRVSLELERLETRDCPSDIGLTAPASGSTMTAPAASQTAAPVISLDIRYGTQRTVTLFGQVTGGDAAGYTVTFSGVVSGSTTTDQSGAFSYTAQASSLGKVSATATSSSGQTSNVAQVDVKSTAPTIVSFTAVEGLNNLWTFSGRVTDESPAGLIVTLGGVQGLSVTATVGADGWFSVTVQLAENITGTATAKTTDWWGLDSNVAWDVL